MSIGKYLSLKEARIANKLERFIKEHKSKGNKKLFDTLLDSMTKSSESDDQTSSDQRDED